MPAVLDGNGGILSDLAGISNNLEDVSDRGTTRVAYGVSKITNTRTQTRRTIHVQLAMMSQSSLCIPTLLPERATSIRVPLDLDQRRNLVGRGVWA